MLMEILSGRRNLILVLTGLITLISLTGLPGMAAAGEPSVILAVAGQRDELALTVYSQGFGLVSDTRRVDLPAGALQLRWDDVSLQLEPASVALVPVSGPDGITVLEQYYDDDLVMPSRLMDLFIGRDVTLVQEDRDLREKRTPARLLSSSGPILEVDGRVVIGHPGRMELPELPPGMLLRPALGWLLESERSGERSMAVRYLSGGINWSAGYRLDLNRDEDAGDVNGWVSVENRCGTDFPAATLRLVAGDVNRASQAGQYLSRSKAMAPGAMMDAPMEAGAGFGEEALSGYHLYTLERPAAILNNRTSRLAFVEASGVAVQRDLVLRGRPTHSRNRYGEVQREQVSVVLRVANSGKAGLGQPLPAGVWQVFKKDASGAQLFLGEERFGHSARGTEVVIGIGSSFDVTAERVQTDYRKLSNVRWDVETAYRITLRNGSSRDVAVQVREPVQGQWELRGSSLPHSRIDASTVGFTVPVAAGAATVLEYRVAIDW